jgi:hypothetical protein
LVGGYGPDVEFIDQALKLDSLLKYAFAPTKEGHHRVK